MTRLLTRLATAATATLGALPGTASAIEQPEYAIVADHGGWELRHYEPYIEARVTVTGPWDRAVSDGFRVLAGYIFGGNAPREKIAMTAPVAAQRRSGGEKGEKIAMTAPVAAQRSSAGTEQDEWTVAFSMPARWTLDSLPVPNDPRIELVEVPAHDAAAIRFGLWATEDRVADKTAELLAGLPSAGLRPVGEPTVAQYNPPWTPPPLRRNEVLVEVELIAPAGARPPEG